MTSASTALQIQDTPNMAKKWAVSARLYNGWQRNEEQQAIGIFQHLLEHKITPQKAAETLASTYEACIKSGDAGLGYLWSVFFDAIDRFGDSHESLERLAQMLISLSNLPDVLDACCQPIKGDLNGQIFWRDIPSFAFNFREAAMDSPYIEDLDSGRDGITWENGPRKFMHGNVFAALYLRELDPDGPERDLSSMKNHACWTLMDALEIATDTLGQVRRTGIYVPPAAMWIFMNGRKIYRYCKSDACSSGEVEQPRWLGGEHGSWVLWTGRDGFSGGRWAFWKARFEAIGVLEGAEERVRAVALRAAEEMGRIESEAE